jgi:hypothetical protein
VLKPGARILIDFINYSNREDGNEIRQWSAFADKDPFSYGIYSHKLNNRINCSESIFVKRNGGGSRKQEYSRVYTLTEIANMLNQAGFVVEDVFSNCEDAPFREDFPGRMIVIAQKNTGLQSHK